MTTQLKGRSLGMPKSRRTVTDLLRLTSRVPAHTQLCKLSIPDVVIARQATAIRIGWPVVMFRAYANVCADMAELRRVFVRWPRPRIYEHPVSVGRMTVAREIDGEEWVVLSKVEDPANLTLEELQADLDALRTGFVDEVPIVQRQLRLASMPGIIRRLAWSTVEWSGAWRTKWLGTYGLTTVSSLGVLATAPPVFAGTMMSFGPISEDGDIDVVLAYDHRVVDGSTVAKALVALERELNTRILAELQDLCRSASVRIAA